MHINSYEVSVRQESWLLELREVCRISEWIRIQKMQEPNPKEAPRAHRSWGGFRVGIPTQGTGNQLNLAVPPMIQIKGFETQPLLNKECLVIFNIFFFLLQLTGCLCSHIRGSLRQVFSVWFLHSFTRIRFLFTRFTQSLFSSVIFSTLSMWREQERASCVFFFFLVYSV
jgi:hypothetical protein